MDKKKRKRRSVGGAHVKKPIVINAKKSEPKNDGSLAAALSETRGLARLPTGEIAAAETHEEPGARLPLADPKSFHMDSPTVRLGDVPRARAEHPSRPVPTPEAHIDLENLFTRIEREPEAKRHRPVTTLTVIATGSVAAILLFLWAVRGPKPIPIPPPAPAPTSQRTATQIPSPSPSPSPGPSPSPTATPIPRATFQRRAEHLVGRESINPQNMPEDRAQLRHTYEILKAAKNPRGMRGALTIVRGERDNDQLLRPDRQALSRAYRDITEAER